MNQPTLSIKCIDNLRLSQWLYNHFDNLCNKKKSRSLLLFGLVSLLLYSFNGSIASTEQMIFYQYGCDSLRYLISRSRIDWTMLCFNYEKWAVRLALYLAVELEEAIALVIDDTLVIKDPRSKNLAIGGKKKSKCGFSLLTSVLVIGHITIPLVPRLCFRKAVCGDFGLNYEAKTIKAEQQLINVIEAGLSPEKMILVMDSWYSSTRMIRLCQEIEGLNYVLGLKCNRNVDKRRVDKLRHGIRYYKARLLSKKEFNYYLSLRAGNLNGVKGEVNVLFSKRERKDGLDSSWRYFVTNLEGRTAIFEWIEKRWRIETFHQIFKHRFKPEKWRVHGIERLRNMLILSTMAMGFSLKYFIENTYASIESLERYIEKCSISESLNYIRSDLISNEVVVKRLLQKET